MGVAESELPKHVHFLCDGQQRPVALASVEHIGRQTRRDDFPIRPLLPVDGKRKEIVVAEVHHREKRVHRARAQPFLRILTNHRPRIPSTRRIAAQIVVLADGRTTHHHPRFQPFHTLTNRLGNGRDVASSLLSRHLDFPRFGIADIVEMDAVDVVFLDDFLANVGNVGRRLRFFRIHKTIVTDFLHQTRIAFPQLRTTCRRPFSNGNRHHPSVQLHSALVALVDGELQRVVARIPPCRAAQTAVPRLHRRWINRRGSHARLQQHHIDASGFQLVENPDEFLLLPLDAARRTVGERFRPVESVERRQPDRPNLIFRRSRQQFGLRLRRQAKKHRKHSENQQKSVYGKSFRVHFYFFRLNFR